MAALVSINISREKGVRKTPVTQAELKAGHGIAGDAHAGPWHRQVSLLALESIEKMRTAGAAVGPGDFAENLTVEGVDLAGLPVDARLRLGAVLLQVTQIGKQCHHRCAIYEQAGDCVMPREGVFAEVLLGGTVSPGDPVIVISREPAGTAEARG